MGSYKKSNELATASYILSESIIKSQKQLKNAVKSEYIKTVLRNAEEIEAVLENHSISLLSKMLLELPKNCGLSEEQIAEYFEKAERDMINEAWDSLDRYIKNNLVDRCGRLISWRSGDESQRIRENASEPIDKFKELINMLEKTGENY